MYVGFGVHSSPPKIKIKRSSPQSTYSNLHFTFMGAEVILVYIKLKVQGLGCRVLGFRD